MQALPRNLGVKVDLSEKLPGCVLALLEVPHSLHCSQIRLVKVGTAMRLRKCFETRMKGVEAVIGLASTRQKLEDSLLVENGLVQSQEHPGTVRSYLPLYR